jgi:malate/lactate dehydrogenase
MSTKVCVLGAAGGIGQPLSMLLKLSPHIDELSCYDIVGTPGVAADLSHVSVVHVHVLQSASASASACCQPSDQLQFSSVNLSSALLIG